MSKLINLSVRQQLLPPDKLAHELKLIPTAEKLSEQSKNKYIMLGLGLGIILGISLGAYLYFQNESKKEDS